MIKYLSLFSGIGAFEKAMINQDIPFELVGYSEIDKYASKSYSEIFNVSESMNLGDITKIDENKLGEVDFTTYGPPCQDISLAGRQKGLFNEDGTKTRSGLFFDALRIIEKTQPKVAIAENVKNLTSKKFAEQFNIILDSLELAGYNNYWKVLNSKDYGIPQNRERVFIVSIRKDLDNNLFQFPKPYELKLRLKDMLEDVADEKYFVDDEKVELLKPQLKDKEISNAIRGGTGLSLNEDKKILFLGNIFPTKNRKNPNQGRVYDPGGIAPALNTKGGGNLEPFILVRANTKKGYEVAELGDSINLEYPNSKTRSGRVGKRITQTITTSPQPPVVVKPMTDEHMNEGIEDFNELAVRRLTPKECFRLQGFYDEDFEKCSCSNTQLYKQAGNSITVDVAEELLCMLFDADGNFFI